MLWLYVTYSTVNNMSFLFWNIIIFQNSLVYKIVPYALITGAFFAYKLF
jgi:hypothetical protein